MIELQLLCEILTGTVAAGSCCLYQGHYNATTPNFTPTQSLAIAKDLDPPFAQFWWDGISWT